MVAKKKSRDVDADAVQELTLWQENTQPLYRQELSIRANLARKLIRGTYDPDQAPKLWKYLADAASKSYAKEFGGHGGHAFSVQTRKDAAAEWARDFEKEAKRGGLPFLKEQIENAK